MGYGGLEATAVDDPIEINALILRQENSAPIYFLSTDVLYVTDEMRERIHAALIQNGALPQEADQESIYWGATHNHHAPACDSTKPGLGPFDPAFTEAVSRGAIELLTSMLGQEPVSVSMHYGSLPTDISTNRRRRVWFGSIFNREFRNYPNPEGVVDSNIYAINFIDSGGEIKSCILTYGCHTVSYFDRSRVTSDYPGVIRKYVREKSANAAMPVLFFQGFSGNVNPKKFNRSFRHNRRPVELLNRLVHGPSFGQFDRERYEAWSGAVASLFCDLIFGDQMEPVEPEIGIEHGLIPISELLTAESSNRQLRVIRIRLSRTLAIYGFGAELFAEYKNFISKIVPENQIIPMSCIGDTFGYLPMNKTLAEGGYEVERFQNPFGLGEAKFMEFPEKTLEKCLRVLVGPQ